ncbi:MAG: hypothetical protein VX278_15905 [Myxococcota bacterium]|nr:hypothetical protein [Myxococcota bacterium]
MYRNICNGVPLLLLSCQPTFTAEISGYVLDAETDDGIEGATIRFFDKEPETATETSFLSETATSSEVAGYFIKTIGWRDLISNFGEDGDYRDLYFGIQHPEYLPGIFHTEGIFSNSLNVVPSMRLVSLRRSVDEIYGTVYSQDGLQNGVRVTLSLGENDVLYDTQYTARINDVDGVFQFSNVEWLDTDNTGSIVSYVRIEDPSYTAVNPAQITQTLSEDTPFYELEGFEVRKKRPDVFSAQISGSAYFSHQTAQGDFVDVPIEGIEISLQWNYDDNNLSDPRTNYVRTDSSGRFETQISWTDSLPDPEDGIPQGEDQLPVLIQFPSSNTGLVFDLSIYSGEYTIRSWIENQLPPAIEVTQNQ